MLDKAADNRTTKCDQWVAYATYSRNWNQHDLSDVSAACMQAIHIPKYMPQGLGINESIYCSQYDTQMLHYAHSSTIYAVLGMGQTHTNL